MNVDWAVAIGIFVVFAGWSIVYYAGFMGADIGLEESMDAMSARVVESLEAGEYIMPVRYDSPEAGQAVLYAELLLSGLGEDNVEVLDDGGELECMLSGDRLYWQAGLEEGGNDFGIAYSESDLGGCSASLATAGANQTFPLAAVRATRLSQARLLDMQSTGYDAFRESLGIGNEIRVEWSGAAQGSYGPQAPGNRDVFVREFTRELLESPGTVDVRVLAWE